MVEDNEKNAKRISVVLLTRNEVHNIEACLKSCSFADEWIVVDDGSSDGTVETARRLGAKVFSRSLGGDWASQKNFGIEQAAGPWIFLIDADERVTPDLAKQLQDAASRIEMCILRAEAQRFSAYSCYTWDSPTRLGLPHGA